MLKDAMRCTKCFAEKPLNCFPLENGRYRKQCKSCRAEAQNKRYKANPEKVREAQKEWRNKNRKRLSQWRKEHYQKNRIRIRAYAKQRMYRTGIHVLRRHKYGLEPEHYQLMLDTQHGNCAICGKKMEKPTIDHNHQNTNVRGLLCFHCNTGMGHFEDNPELLKKAAFYLESREEYDVRKIKIA